MLVKYHANGKEDDELVAHEFGEICRAIEDEKNAKQISYSDFLKTPGNRHRLMILFVQGVSMNWVGNGIISYYLSPILNSVGVTSTKTQLTVLVGLQVWNCESFMPIVLLQMDLALTDSVIIATTAALHVDKAGRRPLWLSATVGQIICMAATMGLSAGYENGDRNAGLAVIPFLFLFYASYNLAYSPLSYSWVSLPLNIRLLQKG